jgi:hypothetical protein
MASFQADDQGDPEARGTQVSQPPAGLERGIDSEVRTLTQTLSTWRSVLGHEWRNVLCGRSGKFETDAIDERLLSELAGESTNGRPLRLSGSAISMPSW